ncbi:hypothetical protein Pla123a_04540 [Posidoniimonas polymericola]|uniref:Uncharacterized protein n=1 Tax=Posidoniimonas polymericola TaxID=2528002 RepID=A0A5C5ZF15_9BACT|nr:hypothetical protein Pla123a_04540 [Posidoniimonas polymericola]
MPISWGPASLAVISVPNTNADAETAGFRRQLRRERGVPVGRYPFSTSAIDFASRSTLLGVMPATLIRPEPTM